MRREVRLVACRGGCGDQVPVLAAVCPACLARLPPDLAAEMDRTHRGRRVGDVPARFRAEDTARAWLLANPPTTRTRTRRRDR